MGETQTLLQSLQDAYRNVVLVRLFPYGVRISVYPSKEEAICHLLTIKKEDTGEMVTKNTQYKLSKFY
jgi:hypothetical protein